jgi:hypothetical protein
MTSKYYNVYLISSVLLELETFRIHLVKFILVTAVVRKETTQSDRSSAPTKNTCDLTLKSPGSMSTRYSLLSLQPPFLPVSATCHPRETQNGFTVNRQVSGA